MFTLYTQQEIEDRSRFSLSRQLLILFIFFIQQKLSGLGKNVNAKETLKQSHKCSNMSFDMNRIKKKGEGVRDAPSVGMLNDGRLGGGAGAYRVVTKGRGISAELRAGHSRRS